MKAKIHKARIPIYPVDLYYCSDAKTMNDRFNLEHGDHEYDGFSWSSREKSLVIIYLPNDNGSVLIPHLVHECLHAAGFVADLVGLEPTNTQNESTAYIAQWISQKILDFANSEYVPDKDNAEL